MMTNIKAFSNQKGGVGKTTSAINIAASLGALGKKVLLVDLDPQGNGTSGIGVDREKCEITAYEVLTENADPVKAVVQTEFPGLFCLPSSLNLAGADIILSQGEKRERALADALARLEEMQFDEIILDCPPSLGLLTINALTAAKEVIVPMQCEYFALEGLSQLMYTVELVRKMYNPSLALGGVILTMFDGRLNLSLAVAEEIKRYFPGKVYRNTVPRNVRLSEAPSYGKPALYYDKYSKGALAYLEIAKEMNAQSK